VVRLVVTGGSLTRRPKRSLRCLLVEVHWEINEYQNQRRYTQAVLWLQKSTSKLIQFIDFLNLERKKHYF